MDGMAWASSAMAAAQTRLDIAAQNLANLSSKDYRALVATGSFGPDGVRIAARPAPQGRVDAVAEMIDVLGAQRAYEGAAKVAATIDQTRHQAAESSRVR